MDFGTIRIEPQGLLALKGKPAPELQVKCRPGEDLSLKQLRGDIVVLDFWGHWCRPCVEDMPALMALKEQFRDQPVKWVTVHDASLSTFSQLDAKLSEFEKSRWDGQKMTLPIVLDIPNPDDDRQALTAMEYGIHAWPTLVVIDQQGNVVGPVKKNKLPEVLQSLLSSNK